MLEAMRALPLLIALSLSGSMAFGHASQAAPGAACEAWPKAIEPESERAIKRGSARMASSISATRWFHNSLCDQIVLAMGECAAIDMGNFHCYHRSVPQISQAISGEIHETDDCQGDDSQQLRAGRHAGRSAESANAGCQSTVSHHAASRSVPHARRAF